MFPKESWIYSFSQGAAAWRLFTRLWHQRAKLIMSEWVWSSRWWVEAGYCTSQVGIFTQHTDTVACPWHACWRHFVRLSFQQFSENVRSAQLSLCVHLWRASRYKLHNSSPTRPSSNETMSCIVCLVGIQRRLIKHVKCLSRWRLKI